MIDLDEYPILDNRNLKPLLSRAKTNCAHSDLYHPHICFRSATGNNLGSYDKFQPILCLVALNVFTHRSTLSTICSRVVCVTTTALVPTSVDFAAWPLYSSIKVRGSSVTLLLNAITFWMARQANRNILSRLQRAYHVYDLGQGSNRHPRPEARDELASIWESLVACGASKRKLGMIFQDLICFEAPAPSGPCF